MQKKGVYGSLAGFVTASLLQPLENIKMLLVLPPKNLKIEANVFKNIANTVQYLHKDDGIRSFYRGIVPTVLRTTVSSYFYFSVLRQCQKFGNQIEEFQNSKVVPFLSSMVGRIAGVIASNPLSVLQTRYQFGGHQRWQGGVFGSLFKIYQN